MVVVHYEELQLIGQLRCRVADIYFTDYQLLDIFLIRWIRAQEGDVNQAEIRLRKFLKWRAKHDMDNILSWSPPEVVLRSCPTEFLGYDAHDSPVTYMPFGKWDLKRILQMGETKGFIKYMNQLFEKSTELMRTKFDPMGLPVTQAVFICDADQLSTKMLVSFRVLHMMFQCVQRFEKNGQEALRAMFIVNAGTAVETLLALIKPLLSRRTLGKLKVYHPYSPRCLEVLQAHISWEILPTKLGGTDRNFRDTYIPPWILEELSRQNEGGLDDDDEAITILEPDSEPQFTTVVIKAGDKLWLKFYVEAWSSLWWEFKTDRHSIAFSLVWESTSFVEHSRVNSHEWLQKGRVYCRNPGYCIFTFDNTHSRIKSKVLHYRINIKIAEGVRDIVFE